MNFLAPLASLLGMEVEHITDRIKNAILLNVTIVVLGVLGAGFLLVAGYIALAQEWGAIYAALAFAVVFIVLALSVYIGSRIAEGRRKRKLAERRRSSEAGAFLSTATLAALPVLLRSPLIRTLGLPAAALAAYLLVSNGSGHDGDDD